MFNRNLRTRYLLFIVVFSAAISAKSFSQDYKLVWSDEFNGTSLDTSKWSYQTGNRRGWGNNEKEYYRKENAVVKDGYLTIIAKKEKCKSFKYTSARIRTINKGEWKYGKIEMRAKLTAGQGIWPAFWMMPTDSKYGTWPQSGEIDIMENLGNDSTKVYGTIHYGGRPPKNKHTGASYTLAAGNFSNQFHTFTVIWEKGKIQWLVDGKVYETQTRWYTEAAPFPAPFNQKFHIILNLAVGGNWPGYPDSTTVFPQKYVIDYVRVYQRISNKQNNSE